MASFLNAPIRAALSALLLGAVGSVAPVGSVAATSPSVIANWPAHATPGEPFVIRVTLPATVAAVDGRVLFDDSAVELLGVAPLGTGTALMPVTIPGGAAFGAYGLHPVARATVLRLVVIPDVGGRIQVRVLIDAIADPLGHRLALSGGQFLATVGAVGGSNLITAPAANTRPMPSAAAGPLRALDAGDRIDKRDLDTVRADWERDRALGTTCAVGLGADANGDGCVDIVDVQAVLAAQGQPAAGGTSVSATQTVAAVPQTYTVTSTLDTPDASPGDGICADSGGHCTLRAAMTEADYHPGFDTVAFDLPGTAPVTIQLGSALPIITSLSGGVLIDGYTQPGSSVNTLTIGSNAIPGVEVRGDGPAARETAFRMTSPGNTIRGLDIDNVWRGVTMDGADAHDDSVIGDWLGFASDGSLSKLGEYGVLFNTGANHDTVGTPAAADRVVDGNWSSAVDSYGPGVAFNTIQNDIFCIAPDGKAATCGAALSHHFGTKNELVGGAGANEGNVVGPTTLAALKYSHGWNPAKKPRQDNSVEWQIDDNQAIDNWLGFREDGSYDPAFRSGLDFSTTDNDEAINIYDGVYDNVMEGNYIASVYDGIQIMAPDAQGNIIRGNFIGQSPLGQAAPMSGWGVKLRWSTRFDTVVGNTIRNAKAGGVGLLTTNNGGGAISPAYNITISQNIVSDTLGPAIYLMPTLADPTKGSNNLTASPVITAATTAAVTGTATNGATVEVYRATRPIGQSGLPSAYLGSTIAGANGTWSFPSVGLAVGDLVTALQIRTDLNTSALSTNAAVTVPITPPGPGDPIASDSFARTVTGGWGTADLGGTYAYTGTLADFSVAGGVGLISAAAGQSREARLNVATDNVNVAGTLSFDRVPTGGNAFAYILARSNGTTAYRAAIRVATSGAVYVQLKKSVGGVESAVAPEVAVPGLSAAAANKLGFRFEVVGTHLQFRVWAATGTEPTTWQTSADDATAGLTGPGAIGLRVYTGSPVTNGPVSVLLGNLSVHRSDVIASDDFERTVAGGWGTATYGGAWSPTGTAADFSVANAAGRIVNAAGQSHEARLAVSYADVSVAGQVSFDRLPTSGNAYAYVLARGNGTTSYRATIRVVAGGAVFIQLKKAVGGIESNVAAEVAVPGISAAASAQIAFRFEVIGTHLQFRVWAGGAPEPTTWLTSADDTTAGLGGIGSVGLRTYLGSPVPNGPVTVSLDAFEVRRP